MILRTHLNVNDVTTIIINHIDNCENIYYVQNVYILY